MFADMVGFTQISETLTPGKLVEQVDQIFSQFDLIISKYSIEKIKTIGDSYMCASGLPKKVENHGHKLVLAAFDFIEFLKVKNVENKKKGLPEFQIRIGINSGPVVAGIVGTKKFAYDIWGDTVNLASRLESMGETGKINIGESTYNLVKNDFHCTFRGSLEVKNKGEVSMYFVDGKVS